MGTLYLGVKRAILRGKEITHIIGVNDNKENLFPVRVSGSVLCGF